ncbi:MFS transporter [Caldicoprobacter faecalis]|uniref:Glycoside/pentoside/hexuronide:cation symporter, GPH family n=1 Tax=Caldicoprobacter faecalis TaxID=937334 RepID=A0A1I5SGF4_9FIRM|nr:MFS transporter [Caldicoprobacter faecalis]SFP69587.1 glycoside/pentoside/hexuronide:cation symporter, GPH family [Caldicoprobacter faecalis]
MDFNNQKLNRLASPWRYALGMLGLTIPNMMYTSYGTFFYNDKIGLSISLIAFGTMLFSIWDAVNDPLMGFLSDRTRTRWGRRRPWLLIGAPLYAIAMTLFFNPPKSLGNGTKLAIYFTVFLMLTETMGTITGTNYHSLFPELFREIKERTVANGIRQALQLVGLIIGVSLTPMLAKSIGYSLTGTLFAFLGMGIFIFSVLGCKEDPEFSKSTVPGLKESFKAVITNSNFWAVSFANFFYQATSALLLAGIPFFVKYTLKLPDSQATFLTGTVFIIAIPAVAVWSWLARKIGSVKTWRIALLWLGLSLLPFLFVNSLMQSIIAGAFIGIGIAGVTATLDLVIARIIDEDAAKSGLRREGIYQSTVSFIIRFSGLMKSLAFILLAIWFGFESGQNPGPNAALANRMMVSAFPLVLMTLSYGCSLIVRFKNQSVKNV